MVGGFCSANIYRRRFQRAAQTALFLPQGGPRKAICARRDAPMGRLYVDGCLFLFLVQYFIFTFFFAPFSIN